MFRPPEKISKSLVVIFILLQLLLGINFGFFAEVQSKRLRLLANLVSVMSFVFIISDLFCFPHGDSVWLQVMIISNASYYILGFFVLRFSKYNFYKFLNDLKDIDEKWNMGVGNSKIGFMSSICIIARAFINIGVFIQAYFVILRFFGWSLYDHYSQLMTHYVIDCFNTVNTMVFHQVFIRMKLLKSVLDEKKIRITDAKLVFKAVADSMEKMRNVQNNIVAIGFVSDFIRCVVVIWYHLSIAIEPLSSQRTIYVRIQPFVTMLGFLIHLTLPAVFAEMIAAKNDELKMIIHNRLLTESDEIVEKDLRRLLRYVEARPLLRKAWRLVPVDMRQPVALLSMCTTYIIVLLQLNHNL